MHLALSILLLPLPGLPTAQSPTAQPLPLEAVVRLGSPRPFAADAFPSRAYAVAISPDGKYTATASERIVDGKIIAVTCLWDARTIQLLAAVSSSNARRSVAFSPDSHTLAWSEGKQIVLWDVPTRKQRLLLRGEFKSSVRIAFAGDGKTLATACADHCVRLWDTATGQLRQVLKGHTNAVVGLAFTPDDRAVFSADQLGNAILWDRATGKVIRRTMDKHPYCIHDVVLSPDGKTFAAVGHAYEVFRVHHGSFTRIGPYAVTYLIDAGSGRQRCAIQHDDAAPSATVFTADSKSLVFSFSDGESDYAGLPHVRAAEVGPGMQVWDVATGKLLRTIQGRSSCIRALAMAKDGQTLVSGGSDGEVRLWNLADGRELTDFLGHIDKARLAVFSSDGRFVATVGDYSREVLLWNAVTGKRRAIRRESYWSPPTYLKFTPDGRYLLFGEAQIPLGSSVLSVPHNLIVWNTATGELVRKLDGLGRGLAVSPDGTKFATANISEGIAIRHLATGEVLRQVQQNASSYLLGALAFSPDGKLLATSHRKVQLCNVATGRDVPLTEAEGAPFAAQSLAFSLDGRYLMGCSNAQSRVVVWEVATGELVRDVKLLEERPQLLGDLLRVVAQRPDGTIVGHDLLKGRHVLTLPNASGQLLAVAPDGRTLATAPSDGSVLLWKCDELAKPLAAAALSPKELDALWIQLGESGINAFDAGASLRTGGDAVVAAMQKRLKSVQQPDPAKVAQLLADLDAKQFKIRDQAQRELEQLVELVESPLRKILETKPTLEMRIRVENILAKLAPQPPPRATLLILRAIAVLEAIGSDAARAVLEMVAAGAPGARVTEEAKAALRRAG